MTEELPIPEINARLANAGAKKVKITKDGRHVYKTPTGMWITVKLLGGSRAKVKTTNSCNC